LETPIVIGAVLNDDPSNITILNLPRSYPRGVVAQANLDGNIYAFVGGSSTDTVPVHIPAAGLESVAITSHRDPATLCTELNTPANVTNGLRNPIAAAHANAQVLTVQRAMVFPTELAAVLQAQAVYSIPQFCDLFIGPNMVTADWAVTYEEIIQWWDCAAMRVAAVVGPRAVPAGPALGFATQQVLTVPQQRLLNNWTRRVQVLVASKVPDAVAPIVASINNLRQDLTTINADCRDEEEEKALPQTFAKRFGTPVCKEVMRYVEMDSMDDLPPLLKTLGSHTKQANDHVAIRSVIDIRASKNNCVANQWLKPVVSAQLLVVFREHHLTATGDNFGEGFTPFTITCAGHSNAKDETAKANRLNLVETGSTCISYADTVAFEKMDQCLPTDNHHQCAEKLQGHSVAVDLYLGVDH